MMEFFDIYNADGTDAGYRASRNDAHRKGLWHKTVHIWIINDNGEVLLQKRSMEKEVHPGLWDVSSAGHVDSGESTIDAAIREIHEELGIIVAKKELLYLFSIRQNYCSEDNSLIDNEITDVFLLRTTIPIDVFSFDNNEVTEVKYVKKNELFDQNVTDLAPHVEEYFRLKLLL